MVVLAARLPDGTLKHLAGFLPACAITVRRLRADTRVSRRARVALGLALLWVLSLVDLVPEFLPIIGPLDDTWSPSRSATRPGKPSARSSSSPGLPC